MLYAYFLEGYLTRVVLAARYSGISCFILM